MGTLSLILVITPLIVYAVCIRMAGTEFAKRNRGLLVTYCAVWLGILAMGTLAVNVGLRPPWPASPPWKIVFWICYALGGALTLLSPLLAWQFYRSAREVRQPGHCPHCDYDLTGNLSGVCSECGKSMEDEIVSDSAGEAGEPTDRI